MLRVTIVYRDGSTETFDAESFNANEVMINNPDIREIITNSLETPTI